MVAKIRRKEELISIILPVYNGATYLKCAIESCLTQTYKNIELLIVDDCSTDSTREIVKLFTDQRITYLRHDINKGLPATLNTGFMAARGEYLTWTSDDNIYLTSALEEMADFLLSQRADFVYSDYYQFQEVNLKNKKIIFLDDKPNFKYRNPIGACFLYSRNIYENIGKYDEEVFLVEDLDYWIRISKKYKMVHLSKPLYCYRIHSAALSSQKYKKIRISAALIRFKYGISSRNFTSLYLSAFGKREYLKRLMNFPFIFWKILKQIDLFKKHKEDFQNTRENILKIIK